MKNASLVIPFAVLFIAGCLSVEKSIQPLDYSKADLSYDRSRFGAAPFPFWFQVTPFEVRTLSAAQMARDGDPEALLALACLSSGNVRDSATYEKYRARVARFVSQVRPAVDSGQDIWHKGFALYTAMRKEFLKTGSDDELAGYDWYQSRLSTVFETGTYNCISSAILYLIVARYFGLSVKGVLLPTHAFVELERPGDKPIEVETTSKTGFDWVHDENYYKGGALSWFSLRGLPSSSYQEYVNRKTMEPYLLICHNMQNQHTDSRKMPVEDIHRLKEFMAFVDTGSASSQKERLLVYGAEFNYLQTSGRYSDAERLFGVVAPVIAATKTQFSGDSSIRRNVSVLEYNRAMLLGILHKEKEFSEATEACLTSLREDKNDSSDIYTAGLQNVYNFIKFYTEKKDFPGADRLITRFFPYANREEWFGQNVQWAYGTALQYYWEKKDWKQVVGICKKQRALDKEGKFKESNNSNQQGAYCNWAASYMNDGNWPRAREILVNCTSDSFPQTECSKLLTELEKSHRF